MIKLLTGQAIHEAFNATSKWNELSKTELGKRMQAQYEEIAKTLNQELGLCENCGNRPADGVLLEVAGDNICSDCCNPPIDESDPNVRYMHLIFNPDGSLAGAITPPAGMSFEEYKVKHTEEMRHINYMLDYNFQQHAASTIPDLYKLITSRVLIATPEQKQEYFIHVLKDGKEEGRAHYLRTWDEEQIQSETGLAQGLQDALYAYAFRNV